MAVLNHGLTLRLLTTPYDATIRIKINEDLNTDKIPIKRRVRQDNTISPKLFTLTLEDIFKNLEWEYKEIIMPVMVYEETLTKNNSNKEKGTSLENLLAKDGMYNTENKFKTEDKKREN
ncbi:PREDICTED: uncharacterized protein LOC108774947 [Cyphomyrmex costatus]|uniref:uncharacterized protein LOC108774947 n=1 Tax=Cyphomyrmex costatus TaxID=456900 RepID=UPI00085244B9|nr:PREDICTED: uncharacterized protein LOC108774947 [Cyphomyrmex costatus]